MNRSLSWKLLIPSAVLVSGLTVPAFAQSDVSDNGATARQSMDAAHNSIKRAGSDTASAAEHAYHGTATAIHDTSITAKVKTALHEDAATKASDIHVSTSVGVVTLRGQVFSTNAAARAEQLAQQVDGVKGVSNKLIIPGQMSAD
jgi:hyperosmotically inducible protein